MGRTKCNWKTQHNFQWDAVSMSLKRTHTVEGSITALHCWSPVIASIFFNQIGNWKKSVAWFCFTQIDFYFWKQFWIKFFPSLEIKTSEKAQYYKTFIATTYGSVWTWNQCDHIGLFLGLGGKCSYKSRPNLSQLLGQFSQMSLF